MATFTASLISLKTTTNRILDFVKNTNKAGKDKLESVSFVNARIKLLHEYWHKLGEQFDHAEGIATEEELENSYFTDDVYSDAETAYLETQSFLEDQIVRITEGARRAIDIPAANAQLQPQGHTVRVKAIEPPVFSGDITQWGGFRDLFRAVITENVHLSGAQRLQYLRTSCQGEAGELIQDIAITDANFVVAWEVLVKRFDNPRVVVAKLLERLLGLKTMTTNSAAEMKVLLDGTNRVVRSLKALERPTDTWGDILVALTVSKLDSATRYDWEKSIAASVVLPTFATLDEFMSAQLATLEALPLATQASQTPTRERLGIRNVRAHVAESQDGGCSVCNESHPLHTCKRFAAMSVNERKGVVSKAGLCYNCIGTTRHISRQCTSTYSCRHCGRKHHTLLHDENDRATGTVAHCATMCNVANNGGIKTHVLLGTARVTLYGNGRCMTVRALIDNGSQASFVSEAVVKQMGLRRAPADVSIFGIGTSTAGSSSSRVELTVTSTVGGVQVNVQPLVLKRVTGKLPSLNTCAVPMPLLDGLQLADADVADSATIDLLLGADVYAQIVQDEMRRSTGGELMAQKTVFGWILIGRLESSATETQHVSVHHLLLEDQLRMFWEQEEPHEKRSSTNEERACEQMFYENMRREDDGRYTVRLPFRDTNAKLGDSRENATRRLLQMERRFARNQELHRLYSEFMASYLELGHMEQVPADDATTDCYFLPHHAVLKPSSTSTKLRVVFDASASTTSGTSLNDMLLVGPRLQDDLVDILMRWRTVRIAVTADVEKMFRQVWIAPEHRKYQRILWRDSAEEEIREYNLNTITYGTACAPYLAVKTMQQLAEDERTRFPAAAAVVLRDFYMDDCLTGADDSERAMVLKDELLAMMTAGGMKLLKWASNSQMFMESLPVELRELGAERMIDVDNNIKTLGVRWFPVVDEFGFVVTPPLTKAATTKRAMLSEIARLFDPLSLLAPVVIFAKILMQSLWLQGTSWDDPLPDDIAERWHRFRGELMLLSEIRVPRWCGMLSTSQWTLHAFCDASKTAYAACVYTRVIESDQSVRVQLLAAKTRVAPLKQTSIPRLELCGALLLSKLVRAVTNAMNLNPRRVTAWTDSTVVLAWLHGQTNRLPTFIANRVGEIQTSMSVSQWRHVPGVDNPADVASRGIMPAELKTHVLWWTGPSWLRKDATNWPTASAQLVDRALLEEKGTVVINHVAKTEPWDLLERHSTLSKLTRVTAYCRRAFKKVDQTEPLRAEEIHSALEFWVGQTQKTAFGEEIQQLATDAQVSTRSKLLSLNPFIDKHGLLRVGGRLKMSMLPFDERHPLILPHDGTFVRLVISDAHHRAFHAGPKLTIAMLQQRFWILGVRGATKMIIHRCVTCVRCRPTREQQLMGELPSARVTQLRAFLHTAVDYAGPIMTRTTKGRGHRAHKSWISVFVCLSSKAVHLELVGDMTTQAFMAAFKRFTARRGHCSDVYADNGTNFVGADGEMKRQVQLCVRDADWGAHLAGTGTRFHFAPPGSPHFNGLAEAAVKIAKSAMRRVIGEHTLTFEEMSTLLAQIEAVMNSRPLGPLTRDKNDPSALTPGHLLIGQSLTATPEPCMLEIADSRLTRWQLLTKLMQHFWDRWRREYLHHLQQREKWTTTTRSVKIGDIVIIRDENVPPTRWPMGRVTNTHPGADGLTRVVTIKTATSELKRAVTKVCVLPVE